MNMKYIVIVFFVAVLLIPQTVLAQDATSSSKTVRELRDEMKAKRDTLREERKALMEEMKSDRENFKERMETLREEMKEKMQQQKDEFKTELQQIKDSRKRTTAERVDQTIAKINEKRTTAMTEKVDKLDEILARLVEKTNVAKENGQDTSEVDEAILTAQTAIEEARTAIEDQADNVYTAEVTSDAALGSSFRTVFSQLVNDLKTTYGTLKTAKESVREVARALAKVRKDVPTDATGSAELTQ